MARIVACTVLCAALAACTPSSPGGAPGGNRSRPVVTVDPCGLLSLDEARGAIGTRHVTRIGPEDAALGASVCNYATDRVPVRMITIQTLARAGTITGRRLYRQTRRHPSFGSVRELSEIGDRAFVDGAERAVILVDGIYLDVSVTGLSYDLLIQVASRVAGRV